MVIAKTEKWTVEKLMKLTREEVLELWGQCPAADMAELDGEYTGLIPNGDNEEIIKRTAAVMYNEEGPLGYWLGKAYKSLGATIGDGYNSWRRPGGKVERYMRFATEMGTSLIDGKPSLMMYYGAYRHRFVPEDKENTLTDEIRKLDDGLYLGVGTSQMPDGTRTLPGHFALAGPVGPWVGPDTGNAELK